MIDKELKPFLLEVNHTPSFQTDSPLDYIIKKYLIIDVINILQLKNTNKKQDRNSYEVSKKYLGNFAIIFPNESVIYLF